MGQAWKVRSSGAMHARGRVGAELFPLPRRVFQDITRGSTTLAGLFVGAEEEESADDL